jgi:hypothetical protein
MSSCRTNTSSFHRRAAPPASMPFPSRDREGVGAAALLFLTLLLPIPAPAVIVDRLAIAVGDKIITESEIDLRIRLTAFQNQEKPELSLSARQLAARELIDQKLVEHEMDVGHYPRLDETGRSALLVEYQKTNYKSDAVALARALAAYQLTPEDLRDDLGRQSDLLTFLNLRFRPAVQVTDQDVQKYFADNIQKGAGKALQEAQTGALNEMRAQIEQKLTTERADKELDLWLQDQHKRTRIEYLEKDLERNGDKQ